jgi:hypothetical protein
VLPGISPAAACKLAKPTAAPERGVVCGCLLWPVVVHAVGEVEPLGLALEHHHLHAEVEAAPHIELVRHQLHLLGVQLQRTEPNTIRTALCGGSTGSGPAQNSRQSQDEPVPGSGPHRGTFQSSALTVARKGSRFPVAKATSSGVWTRRLG